MPSPQLCCLLDSSRLPTRYATHLAVTVLRCAQATSPLLAVWAATRLWACCLCLGKDGAVWPLQYRPHCYAVPTSVLCLVEICCAACAQASRPVLLRAAAAAVRPAQAASAPAGQQAQRSVPAMPGPAPGPRKPGLHRGGQPKGKSLAALALAADTLVEAGQIGVRMPGDPPR